MTMPMTSTTAIPLDARQKVMERRLGMLAFFVREGYSNKRIAAFLGVAEGTVKNDVRTLFNRFGVTTREQLTYFLVTGNHPMSVTRRDHEVSIDFAKNAAPFSMALSK